MTDIPEDVMKKADWLESMLTSLKREDGVVEIARALIEARDKAMEEAADAYRSAAANLHGEFARDNNGAIGDAA